MTDLNRRQFLWNASVGAAAAGAVAIGGTGLFSVLSDSATPTAFSASPEEPSAEGSDIFAHVANAKTGEITIFVGTKAVHYTNRDLAQQLLRAAQ